MLTHLPRGFYEGKPFQIMPSDAIDDGTIIKHYRSITSANILFGVIEQKRIEQGTDVPEFTAPKDVQIEQISDSPQILADKIDVDAIKSRIDALMKRF